MPPKAYTPPLPLYTDGELTPGCEWVLKGHGTAYNYLDGLPAYVHNGRIYEVGDDNTWIRSTNLNGAHIDALHIYYAAQGEIPANGLYRVVGCDVGSNPYGLNQNILGRVENALLQVRNVDRTFAGLQQHFSHSPVYGVLFTYTRGRQALARREDFGYTWPPYRVYADIPDAREILRRASMDT